MKKMFLKSAFVLLSLSCSAVFASGAVVMDYNQDVETTQLLKTTQNTLSQPIVYPKTDSAEVTALRVLIPPGKETGWHKHPVPGYAYIISGTLTLEMEGGKNYVFGPGSAIVETLNTLHNGKNLGAEPVELVVFFTGEKGKPFSVKETGKHPD